MGRSRQAKPAMDRGVGRPVGQLGDAHGVPTTRDSARDCQSDVDGPDRRGDERQDGQDPQGHLHQPQQQAGRDRASAVAR